MRQLALVCLAIVLLPAAAARADSSAPSTTVRSGVASSKKIDPVMAKDVRRLLKASGAADVGGMVIHRMVAMMRKAMPNVPAAYWDAFEKRVDVNDLIDLLVPIYAHHLSHKEILALIKFYQSPAGRAYVKALPVITAESQKAGQQWGMKLAREAVSEVRAKGYQ